jgi:hypothetical protein
MRIPRIHSALAAERLGVVAVLPAGLEAREAETGALRADFLPGVGIGRFIRRRFLELLD